MILNTFSYEKPVIMEDLFKLMKNNDVKLLAGGTDVIPALRDNKLDFSILIDIKGIDEFKGITLTKDGLFIGATEMIQSIVDNPLCSRYTAFVDGARSIGCYEIRCRATIGGNICNGSPSADSVPGLLLYNANALLISECGERVLPLEEFLISPGKVDLREGEVLKGVLLSNPSPNSQSCYFRRTRVKGMDLSGISVAVYCEGLTNFRIAMGAVFPTVARAHKAEDILNGSEFSPELLNQAVASINNEINPRRSSMRASPRYKRHMISVLIKMAIEQMNGGVLHE